jgi:POT family proton-dependent oligopeptide transporter
LIGPFIVGYLGQKVDWHYGFAAAGIGMIAGVIQYKLTEKNLGTAGLEPNRLPDPLAEAKRQRSIRTGIWVVVIFVAALIGLLLSRVITINPTVFAGVSGIVILTCAFLYFIYVFLVEKLDADEKKKVMAILLIFLTVMMFYAGYEGQGSSLNLFADRYTNMFIGSFEMPSSWLQSAPSFFVLLLVPFFAWLWVKLSKKNLNPSTPIKLMLGLVFMGLGYLVMMKASAIVVAGSKPLPTWLITTYMLHTIGEICLYPIGMSAITKLSPKRLVGQMMGVFFMALALGNLVAGLYAGEFNAEAITQNPSVLIDLFGLIVKIMFVAALVVLIFAKPLRKLMGNIN